MAHHAYGHPYDPNCPHCTPAMLDLKTGTALPEDHPTMKIVMRVWNAAPFEQRRAYLAVTADNWEPLVERIQAALKNAGKN